MVKFKCLEFSLTEIQDIQFYILISDDGKYIENVYISYTGDYVEVNNETIVGNYTFTFNEKLGILKCKDTNNSENTVSVEIQLNTDNLIKIQTTKGEITMKNTIKKYHDRLSEARRVAAEIDSIRKMIKGTEENHLRQMENIKLAFESSDKSTYDLMSKAEENRFNDNMSMLNNLLKEKEKEYDDNFDGFYEEYVQLRSSKEYKQYLIQRFIEEKGICINDHMNTNNKEKVIGLVELKNESKELCGFYDSPCFSLNPIFINHKDELHISTCSIAGCVNVLYSDNIEFKVKFSINNYNKSAMDGFKISRVYLLDGTTIEASESEEADKETT